MTPRLVAALAAVCCALACLVGAPVVPWLVFAVIAAALGLLLP